MYTLPLIVTEGVHTNTSLAPRGYTESLPFDFTTMAVQVAINGKPYTYALQTGEFEVDYLDREDPESGK